MDYFTEIRILSDPEFKETTILNVLFNKIHLALVEDGRGQIGLSFPEVDKTLGSTLRLHAPQEALSRLMKNRFLIGMGDYVSINPIQSTPSISGYRVVRRVQIKSCAERLRRRSIAKGWLTQDEARVRIPDAKERRTNLPYVEIKSKSSGKAFRLFIEHGVLTENPSPGRFSAYGLSSEASIPWF